MVRLAARGAGKERLALRGCPHSTPTHGQTLEVLLCNIPYTGIACQLHRLCTFGQRLLASHTTGKVIWAKLGNNPWWPAKTLEEGRDLSFPSFEEPPRPTAIAIRFFGTHEFAWLGSKRQMTDWEEVRVVESGPFYCPNT